MKRDVRLVKDSIPGKRDASGLSKRLKIAPGMRCHQTTMRIVSWILRSSRVACFPDTRRHECGPQKSPCSAIPRLPAGAIVPGGTAGATATVIGRVDAWPNHWSGRRGENSTHRRERLPLPCQAEARSPRHRDRYQGGSFRETMREDLNDEHGGREPERAMAAFEASAIGLQSGRPGSCQDGLL